MMYGTPSLDDLKKLIAATPGANDAPESCASEAEFAKLQAARRRAGAAREAAGWLRKDAPDRAAILAANGDLQAAAISATDSPAPIVEDGFGGAMCQGCGERMILNLGTMAQHRCAKALGHHPGASGRPTGADPNRLWGGRPQEWPDPGATAPAPDTEFRVGSGQLAATRDGGWRTRQLAPGVTYHDPARADMNSSVPLLREPFGSLLASLSAMADRTERGELGELQESASELRRSLARDSVSAKLDRVIALCKSGSSRPQPPARPSFPYSTEPTADELRQFQAVARNLIAKHGPSGAMREVKSWPDVALDAALGPGMAPAFRQVVLHAAVAAR